MNEEVRRSTRGTKKIVNEVNEPIIPAWCRTLNNAKELHGKLIVGTTNNQQEVDNVVEEYSLSLPCDFVKSHPPNLRNIEANRILWQMKDIPFSGVPFFVVAHNVYKCTFAMNYPAKKKRKTAISDVSKFDVMDDPCFEESNCSKSPHTCPAKIIVKKVKRYTSFSVRATATKREKLSTLKMLKTEMENGDVIEIEQFWVWIPLPSQHNHIFRGKDRLIHPTIRKKIQQFIQEGETIPEQIISLLKFHVKHRFQYHVIRPALDDHAYYPSVQSLKNVMYNYVSRNKGSSNESKIVGKRKGNVNSMSSKGKPDQRRSSLRNKKKKNTLQDVVQAFCWDSFDDVVEARSNHAIITINVSELGGKIEQKLGQLSTLAQSLNDANEPQAMPDYISGSPPITDQFNDHTKDISCVTNGDYIPEHASLPSESILCQTPHLPPTLDSSQNVTSHTQPNLVYIPGSEKHVIDTNQILPSYSYEYVDKDITYTIINTPTITYQNIPQSQSSLP